MTRAARSSARRSWAATSQTPATASAENHRDIRETKFTRAQRWQIEEEFRDAFAGSAHWAMSQQRTEGRVAGKVERVDLNPLRTAAKPPSLTEPSNALRSTRSTNLSFKWGSNPPFPLLAKRSQTGLLASAMDSAFPQG